MVREKNSGSLILIFPSYTTFSEIQLCWVPSSFSTGVPTLNWMSVSYHRPTSSSLFCPLGSNAFMGITDSGSVTSAGGSRQKKISDFSGSPVMAFSKVGGRKPLERI